MPTSQDRNLARAAMEEGLVSEQDINACFADMKLAEDIGAVASLDTVLVKKGLLSREQVDQLIEKLKKQAIPSRLGGFEIIEHIGRGGMHSVYKARQVAMGRIVALKILSSEFTKDKRHVERLFKEARSAAQLSHVNIIQAIDVGESAGFYYFATEYVEGESIADRLRREGFISETEALAIAEQVCLALIHINTAAGKIHGDIKPGNIMVTSKGVAKLVDLGLANSVQDPDGAVMCSPHYSSPEQIRKNPSIDFRSDIYSLGATIFHMVSGNLPFNGSNTKAVIAKNLTAPVPELVAGTGESSPRLSRLVQKMLAKDPRDRHQSLEELLTEIRRVQSGGIHVAQERIVRVAPARQSNAAPLIIATILLAAAIGAALHFGSKQEPERPTPAGPVESVVAPVEERLEFVAMQAFEAAEEYARANPDKMAEISRRYDDVARRNPRTSVAEEASKRAKEYGDIHLRKMKHALDETRREADELAEQERFGEALLVLNRFPEDLKNAAVRTALTQHDSRIKQMARERWEALLKTAEDLARQDEFERAIETLEAARKFGFRNIDEMIDERTATYKAAAAQVEQRHVLTVTIAFNKAIGEALAIAKEHRLSDAIDHLDSFAARHRQAGFERQHEEEHSAICKEIETVRDIWASINRALREKIGDDISIRVAGILMQGKLREVTESTFSIAIRETPIVKQISHIDSRDAFALAGISDGGQANALRRLKFHLIANDYDSATNEAKNLPDRQTSDYWTARIISRKGLVDDYDHERRLRATLAQAEQVLNTGQIARAYILLAPLRQKRPAIAELRTQAENLLTQVEVSLAQTWNVPHQPGQLFTLIESLRAAFQWQQDNACEKTMKCNDCEGRGFKVAADQCPRCVGQGRVLCASCRGRGYFTGMIRVQCSDCNGTGRAPCGACSGRGVVPRRYPCPTCEGRTEITCNICRGTAFKAAIPHRHQNALNEMEKHNIPREEVEALFAE